MISFTWVDEMPAPPGFSPYPSKVRCGTTSGYRKHQEDGEEPCMFCRLAKKKYDARRMAAGETQLRNRLHAKAQSIALRNLKDKHPAEYHELYEAAKREVGI